MVQKYKKTTMKGIVLKQKKVKTIQSLLSLEFKWQNGLASQTFFIRN